MLSSPKRTLLAALAAGAIIYATGFLTFGTSLYDAGYSSAPTERIAALQDAIAANLSASGTGAYDVPNPKDPKTAERLAKGPVATVFFQTGGLSRPAANSVVGGMLICLLTGLGLVLALRVLRPLSGRRQLVACGTFLLTFALYRDLGQPIFNAYGWKYFIFLFAQDVIALMLAILMAWWLLRDKSVT